MKITYKIPYKALTLMAFSFILFSFNRMNLSQFRFRYDNIYHFPYGARLGYFLSLVFSIIFFSSSVIVLIFPSQTKKIPNKYQSYCALLLIFMICFLIVSFLFEACDYPIINANGVRWTL